MSTDADSAEDVVLSAEDIPGACLSEPYEQHTIAALRWWLLCRGFKAPTSWKKREIVARLVVILNSWRLRCLFTYTCRVKQSEQEGNGIVDVDGSYLYRKYVSLKEAGKQVSMPIAHPSPPLVGWKSVTEDTYQSIASCIPTVTSGDGYYN